MVLEPGFSDVHLQTFHFFLTLYVSLTQPCTVPQQIFVIALPISDSFCECPCGRFEGHSNLLVQRRKNVVKQGKHVNNIIMPTGLVTDNIVIRSGFNALSICRGLVAAVLVCTERGTQFVNRLTYRG